MPDERDRHPELPVDPDPSILELRQPRPQHAQPLLLLLVATGGFLGAAARYGVSLGLPTRTGSWPTGTFVVNLAGAFLLGVLLEALARRGPDEGCRRHVRLFLGTGFCGAFTTYSTLATETDLLIRDGASGLAFAYALISLFAGLVLTTAGIAVAVGHHRRQQEQEITG